MVHHPKPPETRESQRFSQKLFCSPELYCVTSPSRRYIISDAGAARASEPPPSSTPPLPAVQVRCSAVSYGASVLRLAYLQMDSDGAERPQLVVIYPSVLRRGPGFTLAGKAATAAIESEFKLKLTCKLCTLNK